MKPSKVKEYAITELSRSIQRAAEREEYASAADMKRIKDAIVDHNEMTFTENEIEQLQSRIHQITGDGLVMEEFNKLLGVSC